MIKMPASAGSEVRIGCRTQIHPADFLRSIKPSEAVANWSLTSLLLKLDKIAICLVRQARAAVTDMTPKLPESEQKLRDRSVRRAVEPARSPLRYTISALSRHRMTLRQGNAGLFVQRA